MEIMVQFKKPWYSNFKLPGIRLGNPLLFPIVGRKDLKKEYIKQRIMSWIILLATALLLLDEAGWAVSILFYFSVWMLYDVWTTTRGTVNQSQMFAAWDAGARYLSACGGTVEVQFGGKPHRVILEEIKEEKSDAHTCGCSGTCDGIHTD
jgi:hypothetical protein